MYICAVGVKKTQTNTSGKLRQISSTYWQADFVIYFFELLFKENKKARFAGSKVPGWRAGL